MNKPVLHCQGLTRYFDDAGKRVDIFQQLELTLHRGESLAITGTSGSGKSTLLNLLGGLDKPNAGQVVINGQRLDQLSANQLARFRNCHIGFVYQFHHLLGEFSALENVAMPLLLRGDNTRKARQQAQAILQKVGMEHRLQHTPAMLSGGERQRTAIARALVGKPTLVLADEPTGNLDSQTATQVYELLQQLNQEFELSLIMVTHDARLAACLQNHLLLENGRLIKAPAVHSQTLADQTDANHQSPLPRQ